jgi:hypothetical protein
MGLPGLVLIHGGAHAADCRDLTIDEIARGEPELRVLAVDLPGRRSVARRLATIMGVMQVTLPGDLVPYGFVTVSSSWLRLRTFSALTHTASGSVREGKSIGALHRQRP